MLSQFPVPPVMKTVIPYLLGLEQQLLLALQVQHFQ